MIAASPFFLTNHGKYSSIIDVTQDMIYCKHKERNVPYLMADSTCKRNFHLQTDIAQQVFTDFDYGEDRLEVTYSRIERKEVQQPLLVAS